MLLQLTGIDPTRVDGLNRADLIARRRQFVIHGYEYKYKTLEDVGFYGNWVTPLQITSNSKKGPVLIALHWLDAVLMLSQTVSGA